MKQKSSTVSLIAGSALWSNLLSALLPKSGAKPGKEEGRGGERLLCSPSGF